MNSAYFKSKLRAGIPASDLPQQFAIVTACNPEGETISTEENEARSVEFEKSLERLGLEHFPVKGYDPDSDHAEPGFGVVCDLEAGLALGREWKQEAIFMVESGDVVLVSCQNPEERFHLRSWASMADVE